MSERPFRLAVALLAGSYALLLLLPLVALGVNASPAVLWEQVRSSAVWAAVGVSLATATVATALNVAGGLPLAWLLAGRRHGRWLSLLLDLPLVLPPAVAGLGLILAFGRYQLTGPLLARLGIEHVALTPAAVVLAQMVVSAPLFLRAARSAFESVPPRLVAASGVLGADEAETFRRVVLPLAARGLVGGALLAWARAIGELGATLMFAGNLPGVTQTMPTAIYQLWQSDLTAAVTLALFLLVLSALALLAARHVAGSLAW